MLLLPLSMEAGFSISADNLKKLNCKVSDESRKAARLVTLSQIVESTGIYWDHDNERRGNHEARTFSSRRSVAKQYYPDLCKILL